jgi:hypothetical protein
MKPSISYAITTHDEFIQLKKTLNIIENTMDECDELVILDDFSSHVKTNVLLEGRNVHKRKLNKNYSEHKNFLNSLCSKEYILQLDGDETPSYGLMVNLKNIINNNHTTDLFYIPRSNYVQGIRETDLKNWNWRMDVKKRINYPDYQGRLFKNTECLKWTRDVHERICGYTKFTKIPGDSDLDIIHTKHIKKQIENNNFYNKNFDNGCSRKTI